MTNEQFSKLEAIQRRATRYELAAIHGDGTTRVLIGYTSRQSRSGIMAKCRQHGELVCKLTCPTGEEIMSWPKPASSGMRIGSDWSIRFTGRTQRDAILEGELQSLTEAIAAHDLWLALQQRRAS